MGLIPGEIIEEDDEDIGDRSPVGKGTSRGLSLLDGPSTLRSMRSVGDDMTEGLASTERGRSPRRGQRTGLIKQASIKKPRGIGMANQRELSWKKQSEKRETAAVESGLEGFAAMSRKN